MTLPVLEELRAIGVEVVPEGENLVICLASKVPPELKERLRAHKAEVLEALRSRPATCGPTCYEIEPGRWIHHAWLGCKTPLSLETADPEPPAECKHCGGTGECSCPACTLRRTEKAAPCLMCKPHKRQVWLAATRAETCWHCGGSGKCRCISCGRPGICGICAGSERERVQ
jgi:hypothetical protein